LFLGKDRVAIHGDLEHAASGREESKFFDIRTVLLKDFDRQTGGSRKIVSDAAVFNGQFHFLS
jgi:hypothetical protein